MTLNVLDLSGTGQMSVSWWETGGQNGVALALLGCTQANVGSLYASQLVTPISSSGSGLVPVTTAARLEYRTSVGTRVPILLPAVDPGIFLPDGETVDPSNIHVSALSTDVLALVTDAAGNAVASYVSGTRVGLRLPGIQV
jgi:hypothetical protein